MTTLKPQLVRADTLDLQDHNAPSAKDHTRQPTHPSPYGTGPAAPHQARTLRHAEEEAYQDQHPYSPRASDEQHGPFGSENHFYDEPDELDENHMVDRHDPNDINGQGKDYDNNGDSDGHDEDLDEDLMDKISSSPSIEDGKSPFSSWLSRAMHEDYEAPPASYFGPIRGLPCLPHRVSFQSASNSACYPGEYGQQDFRTGHAAGDVPTGRVLGYPTGDELKSQTISRVSLPHQSSCSMSDGLLVSAFEDEDEWTDEEDIASLASSSEDDTEGFLFTEDSRFIDYGWEGECLQELEDIDFEFVYALHTFVATVEGQANATKGDTMVLLDDSNSYWWLVRVVKDGSIGYLPAEHIETPTERLARLNKHRNIDLSASMLGDTTEKSKNPLKKAMRRRNAKTVNFAPPTYYEPSDYEWSEAEDEDAEDSQLDTYGDSDAQDEQAEQDHEKQDQNTVVSTADSSRESTLVNGVAKDVAGEPQSPVKEASPSLLQSGETSIYAVQTEDHLNRSRKGVVRNTDSFFKDDSLETRKISLTPRLLRGDTDQGNVLEVDPEPKPSPETADKPTVVEEKVKDDGKKKEKKGMLSGLFKRKEKPPKPQRTGTSDSAEKVSEDSSRPSSQSKESMEQLSRAERSPERRPSKLQKHPPVTSPKASPTEGRAPQREVNTDTAQPVQQVSVAPGLGIQTIRRTNSEPQQSQDAKSISSAAPARFPSLNEKKSVFSTVTKPTSADNTKPVYSKRAKQRFAIDASDSEDEQPSGQTHIAEVEQVVPSLSTSQPNEAPRADSAMQVSPTEPVHDKSYFVQPQVELNQPQESAAPPEQSTPPMVQESAHTASTSKPSPPSAVNTPSTSRSTPTWSDASLRTYLDSEDIKDLLIIVHDKSNVTPVGPDHPLMTGLFAEERNRLAEMQNQLDSMLTGWLSRKNAALLTR